MYHDITTCYFRTVKETAVSNSLNILLSESIFYIHNCVDTLVFLFTQVELLLAQRTWKDNSTFGNFFFEPS